MNIKKLLSAKLVDGKKQILVRVDVSRTVRPSLKTGIYVHPELFDEENGVVRIPKNCRRNVELVKEAEDVNCALQSFCLRVTSLCQQNAVVLGIEITKEWLISQISGEKKSNNSKVVSPNVDRNRGIVPVSLEKIMPSALVLPTYKSQDFYKLILQFAKEGKTILMNTLEIPEIQKVADRCIVFYEGRIVKEFNHSEVNEHDVMLYSTNAI